MAVQPKSFVDVSSHNGDISIGDYRTLANKGVGGVVVKLTEDTWYKNPNAENQIRNAQAAGLQVSTYHSLAILLKKQRVQKHGSISQRRNA